MPRACVPNTLEPHRLSAVPARRTRQPRPLGEGRRGGAREPLSAHRRRHPGGVVRDGGDPRHDAGEEPELSARASISGPTSKRASSAKRCRPSSRTPITCWSRRSTPTAMRSQGFGCPRSWYRPAPRRAGTCGRRKRARPVSCAISKARWFRSPRPRSSARPKKIPRLSLEERYKDRGDYAERIQGSDRRAAARRLPARGGCAAPERLSGIGSVVTERSCHSGHCVATRLATIRNS